MSFYEHFDKAKQIVGEIAGCDLKLLLLLFLLKKKKHAELTIMLMIKNYFTCSRFIFQFLICN